MPHDLHLQCTYCTCHAQHDLLAGTSIASTALSRTESHTHVGSLPSARIDLQLLYYSSTCQTRGSLPPWPRMLKRADRFAWVYYTVQPMLCATLLPCSTALPFLQHTWQHRHKGCRAEAVHTPPTQHMQPYMPWHLCTLCVRPRMQGLSRLCART